MVEAADDFLLAFFVLLVIVVAIVDATFDVVESLRPAPPPLVAAGEVDATATVADAWLPLSKANDDDDD